MHSVELLLYGVLINLVAKYSGLQHRHPRHGRRNLTSSHGESTWDSSRWGVGIRRSPVFALFCVGIASYFVIDSFLWQPTGTTNLMRWPFADITIDYQGFYRSSDRWTAVVSILLAGTVLAIDRFVNTNNPKELEDFSPVQ